MRCCEPRCAFVRIAVLGAAMMALVSCDTKGEPLPLQVARSQPPKPLLSDQLRLVPSPAPDEPVRIAGRAWLPTATEYRLPERAVRPVGTAGGEIFHALAWDAPPYDRLLIAEAPGGWREYVEVR